MSTVWLDHMEEIDDEELDAFLLEEQVIMNQQQQLQQPLLPQTNDDIPRPQAFMNTITTTTAAAAAAAAVATNTRAEDIISWLGINDDDDVYIPTLPALPADDDDAAQEVSQENIYNNFQMNDHQVEGVLDDNNNNNNNNDEDQRLFMNVFDHHHHHHNPIVINPDDHFAVPESPFLLDLLCNINDLDIHLSNHQHNNHRVLEEIPPETNYHQASSSCLSPPLVDQNQFFDDPDVSEFTLINDDVENHDLLISATQLVNSTTTTTTATTQDHINEDRNSSHHQNVNDVSTMVNKVINNVTDGATSIDQGVGDGDDDDDGNDNEQEDMDADGECDDNLNSKKNFPKKKNSKKKISTITGTSSLASLPASASASASASVCKNLVSERNRRKRLSQQLLALRSLVPNITKMDKRSVLVDALAHLRSIDEETTKLQNELKHQPPPQSNTMSSTATTTTTTTLDLREEEDNLSAGSQSIPRMLARTKSRAIITEIDTEKIEDQRFVVKITCKVKGGSSSSNSNGVGGDVLRVMESLGYDITCTNTTTNPHHLLQTSKPPQNQQVLLTTLFIRVKNNKHGKMTEEKLRECISNRALRCGLTFQKPTSSLRLKER